MLKLAGHTMGTTEMEVFGAIDYLKELGLDGIEIIIETDGFKCSFPLEHKAEELEALKAKLDSVDLPVAALTPYLNLFNSLDEAERQQECERFKRVIDIARTLKCKNIRAYGGKFVDGETDPDGRKKDALVRSMRELGDYCAPDGIRICLENHFGTMTTTARISMDLVKEIGHPNVGILYDQANLAFFPAEEYEEAIDLQEGKIYYVHCKDLVYRYGVPEKPVFTMVSHVNPDDRTVRSRIPGEGILDWHAIARKLHDTGYDGWLSLEYERRWGNQDLPDAVEGLPRAVAYMRKVLAGLPAD